MFQPDAFIEALYLVLNWNTLMWLTIGVFVGVGLGAIPGLTTSTGVALMLPLTFTLDITGALGLVIGLYKGALFGGSISAISFATPGAPDSAATVFDGYRMTQKGQGRKALLTSLYSSVTADSLSDVLVILIAPMMALAALQFGPAERTWLMVVAIALLGALSGKHVAKGLFAAAIGLYIGTIGSDPMGGASRNTFGLAWLRDGISLVPLIIGLFAMSRMLEQAVELLHESRLGHKVERRMNDLFSNKEDGLTFREYLSNWREMGIGLGVGSFVGMLPGLGATVASFLSYGIAKRVLPHKKIGTGVMGGVAAAESGNNATAGPTLVPLLAFGIPGSATAALIGGALMLQGITPSPRMFELHADVIYALFTILILANLFNLVIGRGFAFFYAKLGGLPKPVLVPTIMVLAVIGSFATQGNPYDVGVMLFFGFIGFFMRRFGIPEAPLIITFLIAPMLEESMRRAVLISGGDWLGGLFNSPLSLILMGLAVLVLVLSYRMRFSERLEAMAHEEEEESRGANSESHR
ncbi:tripartite tricarboxylate transporter permease [Halomonas sp. M5N1S17]|uniref:tripartite tricarboxylate transporter permease n=1 Tax=Halomonas alkalisoli TaxID=2907158 RepID=UPI001F41C6CA|nr:tripartite tricarboxylate transporter permease [Halomonas alkalisoli]MCE9661885.1 tripartite tricarboxylate transporter permease [Halomonas alkalisoli]